MFEDVSELKSDFNKIKLELEALRLRQETTERVVKELRSDAIQRNRKMKVHGKVSQYIFFYLFIFHP